MPQLPTLYSTFDGASASEPKCFKLLDINGDDTQYLLAIQSFEITVSVSDRAEGALVVMRSLMFEDDIKELLGVQYYAEEERVGLLPIHVFSFYANIKTLTKETV